MKDDANNQEQILGKRLGLTSVQAAQRLKHGRNVLVPESLHKSWRRWIGPLQDPMVMLLLLAAPIYFSLGERAEGVATLIALVPIIAVGWVLETRAARTLAKLHALIAPTCEVIRDGIVKRIPVEDLVVDDLIKLTEGQVIPADCRLVEQTHINVDESSLTGESLPTEKKFGDSLLAGTTVSSGRCYAVVIRTGVATTYGSMSHLIAKTDAPKTPLQLAVRKLIKVMATAAFVFALLVGIVEFVRKPSLNNALFASISLLIAAVPEEFSIVYSLYLSLGAWNIGKEHALVRNLPGVETLGSVTVICSDKTGTLTQGKVAVSDVIAFGIDEIELLETAIFACTPNPFDALDQAIVQKARALNVDVDQLHNTHLIRGWPFNPATAYMTQEWQSTEGVIVAAKGAFETMIRFAKCDDHNRIQEIHDKLTSRGTRVLAISRCQIETSSGVRETDEQGLEIVGLIGFQDPIRPEVKTAIEQAHNAGIRIVMMTGDHPSTARYIATELGLGSNNSNLIVHTGDELKLSSETQLDEMVKTTDVFARTRPDEKHLLVESLKRQGEVVAMTGDGVNDAAALRTAHIGVAMGKRGTDVAREAATMVLLDDNFATIVSAIRNGRRIYDNLTRAFAYLIAVHVPLLLLAFTIPLAGLPLLLVPMQLITFEVLLHPIVSLVFEVEPPADDIMKRPPRPSGYALSGGTLWRPFFSGIALSIAIFLIFFTACNWGWTDEQARGIGFVSLLLAQPFMILATRAGNIRIWNFHQKLTREFIGATLIVVITVFIALVTGFGKLLNLSAFPINGWLLMFVGILSAVLIPELFKRESHSFD